MKDYINKTDEELRRIARSNHSTYEEMLKASIVLTDREYERGELYTMEEVFGRYIQLN